MMRGFVQTYYPKSVFYELCNAIHYKCSTLLYYIWIQYLQEYFERPGFKKHNFLRVFDVFEAYILEICGNICMQNNT